MNCHTPDIICMRLKHFDLIHCIVIVNTNIHVISTSNHPLLSCYKLSRSNCKGFWDLALEGSSQHEKGHFFYIKKERHNSNRAPGSSVTSNDLTIVCSNKKSKIKLYNETKSNNVNNRKANSDGDLGSHQKS